MIKRIQKKQPKYTKHQSEFQTIHLDTERMERCGFPEAVYGENKTNGQLEEIVKGFIDNKQDVLITRIDVDKGTVLKKKFPNAIYDEEAKIFLLKYNERKYKSANIKIVTAGTTDIRVALEAMYTLDIVGYKADIIADVGIAGLHRLEKVMPELRKANVIIVIAGMEGALPSVICGLVACPVIAVPSSIGYGVSTGGFTALLGMLASCANGMTVVNIDNGFGAACAAVRILNTMIS